MKRRFELILIVVVGLASIHVCQYALKVYGKEVPKTPPQIRELTAFNDMASFDKIPGKPKSFRFNPQQKGEGYLRFAIPNFDPRHYKLSFSIRAKEILLKDACVRYASGRGTGCEKTIIGGLARFAIAFDEEVMQKAVWTDGTCYVGVAFNRALLSADDEVELVDFKFELK